MGLFVAGCSSSASSSAPAPTDAGASEAALSPALDAAAPLDDASLDAAKAAGDCTAYCAAIMTNCNAIGMGYPNNPLCMANCNALPLGTVGDSLDTVGCRQAHATAAAQSPDTECALAGPFPAGACGGRCDAFCTLAVAVCGDPWQGHCAADCALWPDKGAGATDSNGNTLACREYNVERAFEHNADVLDAGGGCASVVTNSAECK